MGAATSEDTAGLSSESAAAAADATREPLPPGTEETKTPIVAPLPVLKEPGEAQREPYDWPLPQRLSVADAAGAAEGRIAKCCRKTCQVLGVLLIVVGIGLFFYGALRGYWTEMRQWVVSHSFEVAGACFALVGVSLSLALKSSATGSARSAWDDPALGDEVARAPALFSFKIWNDAARFRTDAQGFEDLVKSVGGLSSAKENLLRADPAISTLITKAESTEAERRTNRAAMAKKALVERCKADLEGGMSSRRLQQSLEPRCFVIDFVDDPSSDDSSIPKGSSMHANIKFLRDVVSFLLVVCSPYDEVVVRVTSPGGLVSDYGLASSQLLRFREAGVRLTACIDTVAASGGYMMACVASQIVAAPFAMVGSIGVVAGLPNFHRVLKSHEVDYMLFTAGRYKRTVDVFSENTEEGMAKFQEELNEVHTAFTAHVDRGRGTKIEGGAISTSTGECWLASDAFAKGLVDQLGTSDEYLRKRAGEGAVIVEIRPSVVKRGCFQECLDPLVGASRSIAARVQGVLSGSVFRGGPSATNLRPGLIGAAFSESMLTKAEFRQPLLQA